MARTSGAVGGIAARVAGERFLGMRTDKAAHAEDLKAILGGLKGPLMKVAQFLSTVPDALPEEYAQQLAQLQANAPPMGWNFVRRRMASELGPDWQSRFALRPGGGGRRQPRPGAPRPPARRQRGRLQAAIPGHAQRGGGGPPAAQLAMALYRRMDNAIQHEEVYTELANGCARSWTTSAKRRRCACTASCSPASACTCRCRWRSYCTRRLLTMTWLDGRPSCARLEEDPPQEERNGYAEALFRAW